MKKMYLILVLILLVSCTTSPNKTNTSNENAVTLDRVLDTGALRGGKINLFSTYPDTVNPLLTNNIYMKEYLGFVYDSLVTKDKKQELIPRLAEKWKVDADGKTWTFYIRSDVVWHDGIPFKASDVEFTLRTILAHEVSTRYKEHLKNVVSFVSIDQRTFKVILKESDSNFPWMMTFPILPEHYYANEDMKDSVKFLKPIGTGAYKLTGFVKGQNLTFNSNEKWWGNSKQAVAKPYIPEIEVKLYPSINDANEAFQSGAVDVITLESGMWGQYIGRTDIKLQKIATGRFDFLALNNVRLDKNSRKAISYAIDKVDVVNTQLGGQAVPADFPISTDSWINATEITSEIANKNKAKDLLAISGWKEQNGSLYKDVGGKWFFFNLEIVVNVEDEKRVAVAEKIKQQLIDIGIRASVRKLGYDALMQKVSSNSFDIAFLAVQIPEVPDISFLYGNNAENNLNVSKYQNNEVDRLLILFRAEHDKTKRETIIRKIKEMLNEDMPYIGLYFNNRAMIINKKIRGEILPNTWSSYNQIDSWYLPQQ